MTNTLLPSLGSELLAQAKSSPSHLSHHLHTSFPCVDAAIGGIKYGCITNIQCDVAVYGTLLAHHIITTHLLDASKTGSQVAYVDTTGAFSAVNLLKVLEARLQRGTTQDEPDGGDVRRRRAVELLDRVQYMRTFDFDGVMETVGEVFGGMPKEEMQTSELQREDADVNEEVMIVIPEEINEERALENQDTMEVEPAGSSEEETGERTAIPDSEADSDEEIFWPVPVLPKHDPGVKKKVKKQMGASDADMNPERENILGEAGEPPTSDLESSGKEKELSEPAADLHEGVPHEARNFGVIVFDNISRPLENLIERSEVEANSKLTLLARGLRSLARDQGIAILLLSTPVAQPSNAKEQRREIYTKNPSIFAKIQPTEGLPKTLGSCLDHSIMVSRYPKNEVTSHRRRSGGQDKFIIEVLSERHGKGIGQWGGFTIKGDIEFIGLFKEEKNDERNLDHLLTENEKRGKGAFGRWSRD